MPPGPLIPNPQKRALVLGLIMGTLLVVSTVLATLISGASLI
ncbi:MAG: hypothetical protein AAGC44_09540 [Planctomycetota bacterium]